METALQILSVLLTGAAAASLVFLARHWRREGALRERIEAMRPGSPGERSLAEGARSDRVTALVTALSRLSLPEEGWQDSAVRLRFLRAGIRQKSAPLYYYALKSLLTLALPLGLGLLLYVGHPHIPAMRILMLVVVTAALGYYLPETALRLLTSRRSGKMRDTLPDMIDLMVTCTESGMGIDSAISRISREMAASCPELAGEFYLASIEMRAGASRIDALRNLALRSNLEDLDDLVSMLVQADRFGTSLGESLRVHAEMMRTRRTQRAEELAAKIPVKMVLPLILFIFPTLMLVLLGPAMIQMLEALQR
ncbi:type II secretion system F family protein [Chlorobium sp. N1]|uniref:type II secretion system F family protein n=1 Tax=Chlorobium sp. N1 TaxID=2491138 RepID=UPI00103C0977|nr:type II secretion system F family protein [Chlorobium sp. N1]TCD47223.1 type II secretion system F family protein [Chlorobium sp. N1]